MPSVPGPGDVSQATERKRERRRVGASGGGRLPGMGRSLACPTVPRLRGARSGPHVRSLPCLSSSESPSRWGSCCCSPRSPTRSSTSSRDRRERARSGPSSSSGATSTSPSRSARTGRRRCPMELIVPAASEGDAAAQREAASREGHRAATQASLRATPDPVRHRAGPALLLRERARRRRARRLPHPGQLLAARRPLPLHPQRDLPLRPLQQLPGVPADQPGARRRGDPGLHQHAGRLHALPPLLRRRSTLRAGEHARTRAPVHPPEGARR